MNIPPRLRQIGRSLFHRLGYELRRSIPLDEDFDAVVRFLTSKRSTNIVFDVGANVGQTLSRYRALFPHAQIFSFEPYSQDFLTLDALSRTLPNTSAVNCALGATDCDLPLNLNQRSVANSVLATSSEIPNVRLPDANTLQQVHKTVDCENITVRRIDSFCADYGIERIDFLKLDTQGYEMEILQGAGALLKPDRIPFLFMEMIFVPLYQNQAHPYEVMQFLSQRGYKFYSFFGGYSQREIGWLWSNALFIPAL